MKSTPDISIQTERFLLRPLVESDATEEYRSWFDDPKLGRHIQYARQVVTRSDLRKYIAERRQRDDVLFLGIFGLGDGIHVGNIKFEPIDHLRRLAVLGILVGAPVWRSRGVAQETIPAACSWLQIHRDIRTFLLGVAVDNTAAKTAYERIGFRTTSGFRDLLPNPAALAMAWEPA